MPPMHVRSAPHNACRAQRTAPIWQALFVVGLLACSPTSERPPNEETSPPASPEVEGGAAGAREGGNAGSPATPSSQDTSGDPLPGTTSTNAAGVTDTGSSTTGFGATTATADVSTSEGVNASALSTDGFGGAFAAADTFGASTTGL